MPFMPTKAIFIRKEDGAYTLQIHLARGITLPGHQQSSFAFQISLDSEGQALYRHLLANILDRQLQEAEPLNQQVSNVIPLRQSTPHFVEDDSEFPTEH